MSTQDPRYVTLNAAGAGSETFRTTRVGRMVVIERISIESPVTSSGTVSIFYRGELATSRSLALAMSAEGELPLRPGEAVEVRFASGPPSTQLKVTFHYREIEPGYENPYAGIQFAEAVGFAPPIDDPVLLKSESALTLVGAGFNYLSGILDVRAFHSFNLSLELTNSTFLVTDVATVVISFYADSAGAVKIYEDQFTIYKTDITLSNPLRFTDVCHGPWMRLQIFNTNSVARNVNLTYQLYGSYRVTANAFLRSDPDGIPYQRRVVFPGAGGTDTIKARFAWGRARAVLVSGAGGGATLTLAYAGSTVVDDVLTTAAANTRVEKEIILPRWQAEVTILNGAGAGTVDAFVIREIPPF